MAVATATELGTVGNDVLYIQWSDAERFQEFEEEMQHKRTPKPNTPGFVAPTLNGMCVPVNRLSHAWEGECKEPPPLEGGYILQAGPPEAGLRVRMWTLAESVKLGSVIDVRDFTGRWYEAEVIGISTEGDPASKTRRELTPLEGRLLHVHYLGYSVNYDEWLRLDRDSSRMAHRGTYTVGPNLRARRRNQLQQGRQQLHAQRGAPSEYNVPTLPSGRMPSQ